MTNDLFQENISVPADKTPAPSDVLQQELLTVKEALQKAEKSRENIAANIFNLKLFFKNRHMLFIFISI